MKKISNAKKGIKIAAVALALILLAGILPGKVPAQEVLPAEGAQALEEVLDISESGGQAEELLEDAEAAEPGAQEEALEDNADVMLAEEEADDLYPEGRPFDSRLQTGILNSLYVSRDKNRPKDADFSKSKKYYLDALFGITRQEFVASIEEHMEDYLGVPYCPNGIYASDLVNGYSAPFFDNSDFQCDVSSGWSNSRKVGFNCTGFVWRTLYDAGANTNMIPRMWYSGGCWQNRTTSGRNTWQAFIKASNGGFRLYTSGWFEDDLDARGRPIEGSGKKKLLASGLAEKGDIIWMLQRYASPYSGTKDCHVGIFWGDDPSEDKMLHSGPLVNWKDRSSTAITQINALSPCYYLLIKWEDTSAYLYYEQTSQPESAAEKYTLKGAVYKVYADPSCSKKYLYSDVENRAFLLTGKHADGTYYGYAAAWNSAQKKWEVLRKKNGKARAWLKLPYGEYWLKESRPPASGRYVASEKVLHVKLGPKQEKTVHASSILKGSLQIKASLGPIYGRVVLRLKYKTGTPADGSVSLKGAEYGLYMSAADAKNDIHAVAVKRTDANGRLEFTKLDARKYFLKEINTPAGLKADSKVYVCDLTKIKAGYNKRAAYGVYLTQKDAKLDRKRVCTLWTDADTGKSTKKLLEPGTYYLKELKAPAKCSLWQAADGETILPVTIKKGTARTITGKLAVCKIRKQPAAIVQVIERETD